MELEEKPTILYVDDEEDNLVVFKSAFRRFYKILTATSASEGLEIAKEHNDLALVITDQRMPTMTGVQFLQHLPDSDNSLRMILTGFSDVQAIIDAINTGKVYRYITKPWDKDELKITIDNAIEALSLRKNNKLLIQELQEANEHLEAKVEARTAQVQEQKVEIEKLLLNILPEETAAELRQFGKAQTHKYEKATVLFADIKGFTSIAEHLTPEELVAELDHCFSYFDSLMDRFGLEKIKTIGDAYLCVGGLPNPNEHDPVNVVEAAFEMQSFMATLAEERKVKGRPSFELRIGIHTGPVVAGVVGTKKFAYDIWGDTVNTAARMEQTGEAGKVNISGATYELVKDHFECSFRGKLEAKNKGEMEMYFVNACVNA